MQPFTSPGRLRSLGSRSFKGVGLLLAWLFLPQPGEAFSQEIDFRGTVEIETALETNDGDIQKSDFVLTPELQYELNSWGSLTLIGRLRADPADNLEPGRPSVQNDARSPLSQRRFIGDAVDIELREAYLDIYRGNLFLRLGKQQVVWGQADGLRVLDAVNPLHFREFILPEFEDSRIPLWMANVEWMVGPVTAQFLWIPDHTYDDVPVEGVFAVTSPRLAPRPPEGFEGAITLAERDRPDRLFADDDYGMRLAGFAGGWDWSVNYLYVFDDAAVFRRAVEDEETLSVTPQYERTHLLGGSASNAFGKFTVRTELGLRTNKFILTAAPDDEDGVFDSAELSYVIGLDYQADGDTFLSGQVFQSYLVDHDPMALRDQLDTTFSILARREFWNDTLEAEILALHNLNDDDGLVQLSLGYDLTSSIILTVGADVFYGDSNGLFGQFNKTDRVRLGIEIGF